MSTNAQRLDRETLAKAFTLTGEVLARARVPSEIHVYDGTSIMLQFEARAATQDVDCIITSGHGAVMKAMMAVQRKLGLPSSWLNESVSSFASRAEAEADFFPFGVYPSYARPFLKVMLARPEYLLAMKIEALERNEPRDIADVKMLSDNLKIRDVEGLLAIRNSYFGEKPLSDEIVRALRGIIPSPEVSENAPRQPR